MRIEHVGSTSVPGLAAKPILDIEVVIGSQEKLPEAIARLGGLGYRHKGDRGVPGREAFDWGSDLDPNDEPLDSNCLAFSECVSNVWMGRSGTFPAGDQVLAFNHTRGATHV